MISIACINPQEKLPVSSSSLKENPTPASLVSLVNSVDKLSSSIAPLVLPPAVRFQDNTSLGNQSFSDDESLSVDILLPHGNKKAILPRKEYNDRKELKKILKHPYIQAHPDHWRARFTAPDSTPREIAQNIYDFMTKQRGRIISISRGQEIKPPPHPEEISFNYYHDLYELGRKIRYNAYRGAILCELGDHEHRDLRAKFNALDSSEGTFSEEAIQFLDPNFLLSCAIYTNYWEDISLFVKMGAIFPNFQKEAYRSEQRGSEWISIYRAAFHANYGYFPEEKAQTN